MSPHASDAPAPVALSVTCRMFGRYAEVAGRDRFELTMPAGATVADAVREVRAALPPGAELPERPLAAVNCEHALHERRLADGDELALLPPLAGG